jgi:hypothetical protein
MAFTVTYNGNGATGGTVPVDNNSYNVGDEVTVLDNSGNLTLPGGTFAEYWKPTADGSGAVSGVGSTFNITADITLFAQWFITDGLTNGGLTTHYAFSYDKSLQQTVTNPSGLEPARTNAVIAGCENDYVLMFDWFGGINLLVSIPLAVHVCNLCCGAGGGPPIKMMPGSGDATLCRYLIVSEVTEHFMHAQNKGWYAPDGSDEQSCGEGLSRFLAQQFLVLTGLGITEPGFEISPSWLNSSLPPTDPHSTQVESSPMTALTAAVDDTHTTLDVGNARTLAFASSYIVQVESEQMLVTDADSGAKTLTVQRGYNGTMAATHAAGTLVFHNYGERADYVNVTLEADYAIDAATGCAMLFLYYLRVQLGFSIKDIIAAAPGASHAGTCLRGVYRNLTSDDSDPFPFFKQLLDNAFPPDQLSTIPGTNLDNPWPLGSLSFWGVKDTWGHDEASDLINTSGGTYPNGFWLMLEGFNRQVTGSATPSTPLVAFTGVTTSLDPTGIAYESSNLYAPQRIRYPYDVTFASASLPAFPSSGETPAAVTSSISLLGTTFPALSEFFFIAGADPYFTNVLPNPNPADENAPYLSADLRVFTATPGINQQPVPGAPPFPSTSDNTGGAYTYIQSLIGYLNQHFGDPNQTDPFDPTSNVIPGQQDAYTGDSSVTPTTVHHNTTYNNYNFAIARVRLQGTQGSTGAAQAVKIFFRLWGTQTADTDWNPGYTYLSHIDGTGNPDWPLAPSDNHTIPFFATSNTPNFTDTNNPEYGTNGVNNQTITILQNDKQWAYFGCFLNVYDASFVVNSQEVKKSFPGTHHCLVAEMAYAGAPIKNVGGVTVTPETSSQLAQRNLQVTLSDNPGPAETHRIPQTFDARLSVPAAETLGLMSYPDELMIDWGQVPVGSTAQIYWPAIAATDVLALSSRFYAIQGLSAVDAHTVKCVTTNGVTYVPIPFGTGDSLASLFTVDLPQGIVEGQQFNIVVRRVSSRRRNIARQPPPIHIQARTTRAKAAAAGARAVKVQTIVERYVVGSFQVKIPVSTPKLLLHDEQNTLAIFKARLGAMVPSNRWYPVLRRYIGYLSGRVNGMGGNASQIPPSFNGAPIGAIGGKGGRPGNGKGEGKGEGSGEFAHTGKIAGLIFDHFGDFEGFLLDTGEGERTLYSRERDIRDLAERAWQKRLRITVYVEAHDPHRIRTIIVREPPAVLQP